MIKHCDECGEAFDEVDLIHTHDGTYCEECYDDLKEVDAL